MKIKKYEKTFSGGIALWKYCTKVVKMVRNAEKTKLFNDFNKRLYEYI